MTVLRHILAVLWDKFSTLPNMTDKQAEDPLHGLHVHKLRILSNIHKVTSVDNEALHQRIEDACQTIRNYHAIFERGGGDTRRDVSRRALSLMEGILSTDYKRTPSGLTNKLNFPDTR
jgi:hypothetical protein